MIKRISEIQNLQFENPTGAYANDKELKILGLVFKWKIIPLFILSAHLLRGENPLTFKKRVYRLVEKGLLKKVKHLGDLVFFQLTKAGFLRFRQGLDGLKEDGFASEAIRHDFLSMALQLGPWAMTKPRSVEIVSEQELRRFIFNELPSWLPTIDTHRPDGFTQFKKNNRSRVFAFEIEINSKPSDRYGSTFQYYNKHRDIDLVIWLVKNKGLKKILIDNCLHVDERDISKHAFILLDDFKSSFWDAKIEVGQKTPISFVSMMSQECLGDVSQMSLDGLCPLVPDFQEYLAKC